MIYVLDTNALVWYLSGDPQLSQSAKNIMDNPGAGNWLAVPTIVLVEAWDLQRKHRRNPVPLKKILRSIRAQNVLLRDLTLNVVNLLPDLWEDSRDMIILATALDLGQQYGSASVVSSDRKIRKQSIVPCVW